MTRNELISAVLAHLKLLPAGQSPAPEDVEIIDGRLATIAADLSARDIAYVDVDDIADEQAEQFLIVVAERVAPLFEIPTDRAALAEAEDQLEVIGRAQGSGQMLKTERVMRAGLWSGRRTWSL
jgi:hypothetical protein